MRTLIDIITGRRRRVRRTLAAAMAQVDQARVRQARRNVAATLALVA
jgi:hypothetical protein